MTEKEKLDHNKQVAAARAAKQEYILKGQSTGTWSSKMPAYVGTNLCLARILKNTKDN